MAVPSHVLLQPYVLGFAQVNLTTLRSRMLWTYVHASCCLFVCWLVGGPCVSRVQLWLAAALQGACQYVGTALVDQLAINNFEQ
jgi:hypothetical protein